MSIGFHSAGAAAAAAAQQQQQPEMITTGDTFLYLAIEVLAPSPTNPRKHFDQRKLDELAASIREHGINQPLLVRPMMGSGRYEIVAGERRYRAAQIAGQSSVPCIARALSDQQTLEIQAIENLQRDDLTPLEEANGYHQLIEKNGYDVAAIAARIGKSPSYVYGRLALLSLVDEARAAMDDEGGKFTLQHAVMVSRLQPDDQRAAVAYVTRAYNRVSVADLREWIADEVMRILGQAPFDVSSASLLVGAGSCTGCQKRTGAQPGLFDDIVDSENDRCLDAVCFRQKVDNHVIAVRALVAEKAKATVKDVPLVASSSHAAPGGVVKSWQWSAATKTTPGARQAVIASGPDAGKVVWAKFQPGALESNNEKRRKADSAQQRQADAMQKRRDDHEIARRLESKLAKAIISSGVRSVELRAVGLRDALFSLSSAGLNRYLEIINLPITVSSGRIDPAIAIDHIRAGNDLSSDSRFAFLIESYVLASLADGNLQLTDVKALASAAAIDSKELRKKVAAEYKTEQKQKAADAEAAKKSKKPAAAAKKKKGGTK